MSLIPKQRRAFVWLVLLLMAPYAKAVDYASTGATTSQVMETRLGADFTKKWRCGVSLSLSEDLRFAMYNHETGKTSKSVSLDTTYAPYLSKSYTTLAVAYAPVPFLKIDAGYTLRLLGNKGWSDPNEFLRHRVFFSLQGSYKTMYYKLYLRERALLDMRTDSVNTDEKNKNNWSLRSRLGIDCYVPGKPVTPFAWVELENTLNAPEYQQKNNRQYISTVRAQVGVKWRVSRLSTLHFYYRFTYGYDRDVNVNKKYYTDNKSLKVRLDEETLYKHAIGVSYNLDW